MNIRKFSHILIVTVITLLPSACSAPAAESTATLLPPTDTATPVPPTETPTPVPTPEVEDWWSAQLPSAGFVPAEPEPEFDDYITISAPVRRTEDGEFVRDEVLNRGWDETLKTFYFSLASNPEYPLNAGLADIPPALSVKILPDLPQYIDPESFHTDAKVTMIHGGDLLTLQGKVGLAISYMGTIAYMPGLPGTRLDISPLLESEQKLILAGKEWQATESGPAYVVITTGEIIGINVTYKEASISLTTPTPTQTPTQTSTSIPTMTPQSNEPSPLCAATGNPGNFLVDYNSIGIGSYVTTANCGEDFSSCPSLNGLNPVSSIDYVELDLAKDSEPTQSSLRLILRISIEEHPISSQHLWEFFDQSSINVKLENGEIYNIQVDAGPETAVYGGIVYFVAPEYIDTATPFINLRIPVNEIIPLVVGEHEFVWCYENAASQPLVVQVEE